MADQDRARTRPLAAGACVLTALLALGALLGTVWWLIAPRARGTALGGGEIFTGTDQAVFAAEGYFVLMTALTGLVTGYAAYMLQFPLARRRFQDLRMVFLLSGFAGALGGAVLAWRVGVALDAPARAAVAAAEAGTSLQAGLRLDATAFLLVWPLVFVLQYGLLDAVSFLRDDQPGVPPREAPETGDAPGTGGGSGPDASPAADRDHARPRDTP
ncbi:MULTISPECIES: hypothetical protein [unclassified Nocardiopsis]|uniref:hypothetical protein n=1 Tax=unclassified Nocardiopsis TaxID=2649073 RepID=UPI001F2F7103|nr:MULTISPECIES: hypothetical protein [unclassified Nocardiopsis]